jgi:hypothetical protein
LSVKAAREKQVQAQEPQPVAVAVQQEAAPELQAPQGAAAVEVVEEGEVEQREAPAMQVNTVAPLARENDEQGSPKRTRTAEEEVVVALASVPQQIEELEEADADADAVMDLEDDEEGDQCCGCGEPGNMAKGCCIAAMARPAPAPTCTTTGALDMRADRWRTPMAGCCVASAWRKRSARLMSFSGKRRRRVCWSHVGCVTMMPAREAGD